MCPKHAHIPADIRADLQSHPGDSDKHMLSLHINTAKQIDGPLYPNSFADLHDVQLQHA